ncbi:MAG: hypothetical protein IT306_13435 [Chloroflexi bacterium]|nr:hypothetical protein [Chloroflexota bacterium]
MDDAPTVEHWLALLRDGSAAEQQRARTELGLILEARGFLDEAADAYERNVRDGVTDRRPYDRLAAIARQRGDAEAEARVLRALAEMLAPVGSPGPLAPLPPAEKGASPATRSAGRWLLAAGGVAVVSVVIGGALLIPVRPPAPPASALVSPSAVERAPSSNLAVAPAASTLLPSPVPSPTAPPPSPVPAPSPTATAVPLASRCTDAAERFPQTNDTEAAVRAAYATYMGRQGVTIDPTSALFTGQGAAYVERHAEVVAGWMAVSLQRERRGLPTFPLVDYVASDIVVASGQDAFQLRATISPQGWTELRALPADTCEGAFLKHPDNARWVDLMQASVGDITWAIPTPQPRR